MTDAHAEISYGGRLFRLFGQGRWEESVNGRWTAIDRQVVPAKVQIVAARQAKSTPRT